MDLSNLETSGIELGDRVKDVVTEFEGIAVMMVVHLNGCIRFGVQPGVDKDGKDRDCGYFDHMQLEVTERGVVSAVDPNASDRFPMRRKVKVEDEKSNPPGGPPSSYDPPKSTSKL